MKTGANCHMGEIWESGDMSSRKDIPFSGLSSSMSSFLVLDEIVRLRLSIVEPETHEELTIRIRIKAY